MLQFLNIAFLYSLQNWYNIYLWHPNLQLKKNYFCNAVRLPFLANANDFGCPKYENCRHKIFDPSPSKAVRYSWMSPCYLSTYFRSITPWPCPKMTSFLRLINSILFLISATILLTYLLKRDKVELYKVELFKVELYKVDKCFDVWI